MTLRKFCEDLTSKPPIKCRKEVDSRWSWLVCFCATSVITLTLGISLNFGIMFPMLMYHFQETRERTAWIGSIGLAFTFTLGPFTSALVNRFGCRLTSLIGGIFCICGLFFSSLASNIAVMYVTYSVLYGFGSSCLFVSCYVVVSQYFDKKQSIATGIIASGAGLGSITVAPILQALLNSYGWKKTYRITAGILSMVCVFCMSFDPSVSKKGEDKEKRGSENSDQQDKRIMKKPKRWFLDFSVFKKKMFVVCTLSITLNSLGHNTPRLHLVKFSEDLNVSADTASRLFIYLGITSLIGRLLTGFICNLPCVNPVYMYMVGLILDGSSHIFFSQAKTYGHLIASSCLYGLADGLLLGTFFICILNSVEASKKASAFGLSALCFGPLVATGPALAGFMTDHLHSYIPSFILAAVASFVSAALLLILVCDKKQTQNFHPVELRESGDLEQRDTTIWETSL